MFIVYNIEFQFWFKLREIIYLIFYNYINRGQFDHILSSIGICEVSSNKNVKPKPDKLQIIFCQ